MLTHKSLQCVVWTLNGWFNSCLEVHISLWAARWSIIPTSCVIIHITATQSIFQVHDCVLDRELSRKLPVYENCTVSVCTWTEDYYAWLSDFNKRDILMMSLVLEILSAKLPALISSYQQIEWLKNIWLVLLFHLKSCLTLILFVQITMVNN